MIVSDYAEWSKTNRTDEKDTRKSVIDKDGARTMDQFLSTLWPVVGEPGSPSPKDIQDCNNRDYLKVGK